MMRFMDAETQTISRETQMTFHRFSGIACVLFALLCSVQLTNAQSTQTNYYNTLQTISYASDVDSFQQNLRAIVRSTTLHEEPSTLYKLAFEGGITFPSATNPTVAASEEIILARSAGGKLKTEDPSLSRTIAVINSGVDWATSHSLPENKQLRIPIDLGNGVTSYALMTFDSEPVDIGAGDDTRLVTVRSAPRRISGRSGVFTCAYNAIFIYSPKNDQLYQSTSVFTANNNVSEQFRLEEQTFLTTTNGTDPQYELVDYKNRLGTFTTYEGGLPMSNPPPPWVIEAMTARESLYCQGKAIVYQKTNWVFVSAFIANTSYALMNYAWNAVTGETLVTSVRKNYPEIGSRLQHVDIETIVCNANTTLVASALQLTSTVASETASLGAKHVSITPDAKLSLPERPSVPVAAAGSDLMSAVLIVGGAGAAIALGTSSSGGSSGACAGNGLVGNYTATISSPCNGTFIPASYISLALALNSSCSVTGTANVDGETLAVTPTTWSYASGILTIGSFPVAVADSATTFETPLEQIFPAVAAAVLAAFDLLDKYERDEIIANCGTPEAYVSGLQMTWTR